MDRSSPSDGPFVGGDFVGGDFVDGDFEVLVVPPQHVGLELDEFEELPHGLQAYELLIRYPYAQFPL